MKCCAGKRRGLSWERSSNPEITRFKGLGEISPKEFAQFIGKEMRLSKVEYAPKVESGPIFTFYMGKNTPERKDYIMERLVVPVEEQSMNHLDRQLAAGFKLLNKGTPDDQKRATAGQEYGQVR